MNWDKVTVRQYQQLAKIKADTTLTVADIAAKAIAVMFNITERQVDGFDIEEFNKKAKELSFLQTEMPSGKPAQYIEVNGRKYKCLYDIRKLKAGRYLESKAYATDTVQNLHLIAASMVHPMRRRLGIGTWGVGTYDIEQHNDYAQDMLDAPFVHVYGSILFFCKVYADSIKNLNGYLSKGLTEHQQNEMVEALSVLCSHLDGYTKPL